MDLLAGPMRTTTPSSTEHKALPGGDIPNADFNAFHKKFTGRYPWLPAPLAYRYARAYGTRADLLLAG